MVWEWLRRAVRLKADPIRWPAAARAALVIGGLVVLGVAVGDLEFALLSATGAVFGVIQNAAGPYRLRALAIGLPMLSGAAGVVVGEAVFGHGWAVVAALAAVALVSGLVSAVGPFSSNAGLTLLIMAVICAGVPLAGPWWRAPLFYLAGASTLLVVGLLAWPLRRDRPERDAVAAVYRAIADALDTAAGTGAGGAAGGGAHRATDLHQKVTRSVDDAADALFGHRLGAGPSDTETVWLTRVLNAANPLLNLLPLAAYGGPGPPPGLTRSVRDIAAAVAAGRRTLPPAGQGGADPGGYRTALEYTRHRVTDPATGDPDLLGRPPSWPARTSMTARRTLASWPVWRFALRLALCIGLVSAAARVLPLGDSYWAGLTVAVILKPDFGSVFVRGLLRAVGTVLGVLVATAALAAVPRGAADAALAALFAGLVPVFVARSLALQTAAVTPLILVLVNLNHPVAPATLVQARLGDTALACAIVLVFGYLLWPETRRVRIVRIFAGTLDSTSRYLERAFTAPLAERSRRRRALNRSITALRTRLDRRMSEPPPVSVLAHAWVPAVDALQRSVDAVTAASAQDGSGARHPPEPAELAAVVAAMDTLAGTVRATGPTGAPPGLPQTGPLARITAELDHLWMVVPPR